MQVIAGPERKAINFEYTYETKYNSAASGKKEYSTSL